MKAPGDEQATSGALPFKPDRVPMCRSEIVKRLPNADEARVHALGTIWDEVVHHIINEMLALTFEDAAPLHINIREDVALELAQLSLWLSERVIERRTAGRAFSKIDPLEERKECLGPRAPRP